MSMYSDMRKRIARNFVNYNKDQAFDMLMLFVDRMENKDLEIEALSQQLKEERNDFTKRVKNGVNDQLSKIFVNMEDLSEETLNLIAKVHTKKNVGKASRYAEKLIGEAKAHRRTIVKENEEVLKAEYAQKSAKIAETVQQETDAAIAEAKEQAEDIIRSAENDKKIVMKKAEIQADSIIEKANLESKKIKSDAEVEKNKVVSEAKKEQVRIVTKANTDKEKILLAVEGKKEQIASEIELKILKAETDIDKLKEVKLSKVKKMETDAREKLDTIARALTDAANQNKNVIEELRDVKQKQQDIFKKLVLLIDFAKDEIVEGNCKSELLAKEIELDENQLSKLEMLKEKETEAIRKLQEIASDFRK